MSNQGYNKNDKFNKNFSDNKQYKKHSGASIMDGSKTANKVPAISAWNVSKEKGFVKLVACPNQKSHKHAETGNKTRGLWTCSVSFLRTGEQRTMSGIYHTEGDKKGNLYIPALGWVVNPKAPNGGYCGTAKFSK